jgi:hypothetical protein
MRGKVFSVLLFLLIQASCLKDPLEREKLIFFTAKQSLRNTKIEVFLDDRFIGQIKGISTVVPDCYTYGPEVVIVSLEPKTYTYSIKVNGVTRWTGEVDADLTETCWALEI